ncbi:hypothetical protein PR202_gb11866 [Eleusine coracana subsp. coracana]|uniref:Kinesin motor domain-containing protein n=1 Tax=Eleusine coracana subsp. coracana TaxID=191504 RepID=A0AAV5ELK2_ELECO|nr:hypothetical protein PR202_gb11866 [Eleusine coracana subsp. coracana]
MEMLRRNLKRQASRSLSALAAATSPRAAAADQENLHPNLTSSPPASPAKTSSAKDRSSRPKQHPTAAAEDDHAVTPAVDETSVKVVVRVRPPVSLPTDGKDLWFVRKTSPDCVAVGDRAFAVDGVLDDRASQADAFDMVGLPMIESALAGFNTSLVCYGQSGTGKTYTMWGPLAAMVDSASDQTDLGVVPRVFQDLFTRIQSSQESSPEKQISYQCRCSFLEVHNEQINDLLEPSQRDLQGLSNRKVGTTSMNLKSSRSHVVFTCVIEAWSKGFASNGFSSSRTSRITFVDLAGPENDELDGAAKHCTKEERHLKKSLSKLGKLVNILSEALESQKSMAKVSSAIPEDERTVLCSSCKKPVNTNENQTESAEKQIVVASNVTKSACASLKNVNNSEAIGSKRETELEALCKEQAAKIKELSILIDQLREGSKDSPDSKGVTTVEGRSSEEKISEQCGDNKMTANEREALLNEIESLKEQLNHQTNVSTNGSLLDQIRNGETDQEYELDKERQRWMESESKWISLTEELRVDLESNRMHAEKTEMELCNEKKCTAELDDALQRAMYGHARMVEHYVELQELYNDLLEKHRRVMDAISEVKRAAAKAGRKGCGTAFAAALAAELSTVRIDREKERTQLKEQNRRLRIQLRDTAEAVHAAGELLNEKLKKQLEKMRKKHEMEVETMKVHLAESRLPESALGHFYRQENEEMPSEYSCDAPLTNDDESWRSAFALAYE